MAGTTLTGSTPSTTYDALLKMTDNAGITGSLKMVTDGLGVDAAMKLSSAAIEATGLFNLAAGSAGAPSLAFTAEATLGLYRYASGFVGMAGGLKAINAAADTQLQFGQDSTHNLNLLWTYNATANSASATFGTFSKNNDLTIQGKAVNFDTSSLAFAVQMFSNGRVRVGGGADDGASALQVAGALTSTSLNVSSSGTVEPLITSSSSGFAGIKWVSGANTWEFAHRAADGYAAFLLNNVETTRQTSTGFRVIGAFGCNGAGETAKQTVSGSRGGNTALASLLTSLAAFGLITDSTTA